MVMSVRNALLADEVVQLARLVHLAHDIAAADELTLDIELGNGRPVGEALDAFTQSLIFEYVHVFERYSKVLEDLGGGRRETALGKFGRSLHEKNDVVALDRLFDLLMSGVGHEGVLSKQWRFKAARLRSTMIYVARRVRKSIAGYRGRKLERMQDVPHSASEGVVDHLMLLDAAFALEGGGHDVGCPMVVVAGEICKLNLGVRELGLDEAFDFVAGQGHGEGVPSFRYG